LTNISIGKERQENCVSVSSNSRASSNIRQQNDEPNGKKDSDEDDDDESDDDGYSNYYIFGIDSSLLTSIFIYFHDYKAHLR
jgi:hypothetical protein